MGLHRRPLFGGSSVEQHGDRSRCLGGDDRAIRRRNEEQLRAITNAIGRDAELVDVETVAQLEEVVEMPAGPTGPEGALAPETPAP